MEVAGEHIDRIEGKKHFQCSQAAAKDELIILFTIIKSYKINKTAGEKNGTNRNY
ncbi:MAG: hypothetical protein K9J16_01255 [Melioribacteraceae bacterium]|nr:hypothetical protein [Melioribacteraceae bacterium]MCF8352862.1 hypothetical protein [Melioribacteraceae bacterium]MCF8393821.1 hypothetical protein [Melioribacteraceae bacterium]MCF8417379.1 hypothetical protein [Melioribacteraceae bacterium]